MNVTPQPRDWSITTDEAPAPDIQVEPGHKWTQQTGRLILS